MIKKEMISRIAALLRENDIRKPVSIPKQVFHISDDNGNSKDFKVRQIDRNVLYTAEDVENIIDACQYVIQDALKNGETVSVHGFGRLELMYTKERTAKNVLDGQEVFIEGHYRPRFLVGNDLRRCAQVYEQMLKDRETTRPPQYDEAYEADGIRIRDLTGPAEDDTDVNGGSAAVDEAGGAAEDSVCGTGIGAASSDETTKAPVDNIGASAGKTGTADGE